jgi:hypothetical protein
MTLIADKKDLKLVLKEWISENPSEFNAVLEEVLEEAQRKNVLLDSEMNDLINRNFSRFKATFEALA